MTLFLPKETPRYLFSRQKWISFSEKLQVTTTVKSVTGDGHCAFHLVDQIVHNEERDQNRIRKWLAITMFGLRDQIWNVIGRDYGLIAEVKTIVKGEEGQELSLICACLLLRKNLIIFTPHDEYVERTNSLFHTRPQEKDKHPSKSLGTPQFMVIEHHFNDSWRAVFVHFWLFLCEKCKKCKKRKKIQKNPKKSKTKRKRVF